MVRKIYLASALFSIFEREKNAEIAEKLRNNGFEVLLPQTVSAPMTVSGPDMKYVYDEVLNFLKKSDLVLAIVDGAEVDTGVAWELGYAAAMGIPTFCLRTDFRKSEANGVNIMIEYSATKMIYSTGYTTTSNESIDEVLKVLKTK